MQNNKDFDFEPPKNKAIIYRYYDEGGSYIGSTKHSLSQRMYDAYGYVHGTSIHNKFARRIFEVGYLHFKFEILEIVDEKLRYSKENDYIIMYDSVKNGYNSRYNIIK